MTFVRNSSSQSTVARRPQPAARTLFVLALAGVSACLPTAAEARQQVTVQRDGERFVADPGGKELGRLAAGAAVTAQGRRGTDTQVLLDGWIFGSSVKAEAREGHTLAVTPPEENVRAAPNGRVLARLVRGALLDGHDGLVAGLDQAADVAGPLEALLDRLESVQIKIQHRHGYLLPLRMGNDHRHSLGEKPSVRKPRQRVIPRQGFQHLSVFADRLVQQADFQHVVNPHQHLGQIEWLADEILRAAL